MRPCTPRSYPIRCFYMDPLANGVGPISGGCVCVCVFFLRGGGDRRPLDSLSCHSAFCLCSGIPGSCPYCLSPFSGGEKQKRKEKKKEKEAERRATDVGYAPPSEPLPAAPGRRLCQTGASLREASCRVTYYPSLTCTFCASDTVRCSAECVHISFPHFAGMADHLRAFPLRYFRLRSQHSCPACAHFPTALVAHGRILRVHTPSPETA